MKLANFTREHADVLAGGPAIAASSAVSTHASGTASMHVASAVTIADAGNYYTSGTVEGALQELGAASSDMLVYDESVLAGTATSFDFQGAGVSAAVSGGTAIVTVTAGTASTSIPIYDEGSLMGTATTGLNFVGSGVSGTVTTGTAVITITGGTASTNHAAFTYFAASLEPLAIERLYSGSGTLRTAGASETILVVSAFNTDLGSGRWEIRDPRHPLMPLRDISIVGNGSDSVAVVIDPSLATYADAWDTYYDRLNTIYTTKPLYLPITAASTYAVFLPGPYGSIITSVAIFDGTWLVVRPYGTTLGWNLHDEQGDAAGQAIRFAHPTLIPVSKYVAARLLTGLEDTVGGSPDIEGSITYINCASSWGAVTDATSYDFRDDFMGTALDTGTDWTRTQSTAGNMEIQTAAGLANWCQALGDGTWGNNTIYSQTGVARSAGKIFMCDVYPAAFSNPNYANLMVGWHDGAGTSYTDLAHGLDFTGTGTGPTYQLQVFEAGTSRGVVGSGYTPTSIYRVKITLDSAGANTAKYEIQGGSEYQPLGGAAWTDITPGTTSNATTPVYAGIVVQSALASYVGDVKVY